MRTHPFRRIHDPPSSDYWQLLRIFAIRLLEPTIRSILELVPLQPSGSASVGVLQLKPVGNMSLQWEEEPIDQKADSR